VNRLNIDRVIEFSYPSVQERWVEQSHYTKPAQISACAYHAPDELPQWFDGPFVVVTPNGTAYANTAWSDVFPSAKGFAFEMRFMLRRGSVHRLWRVDEAHMLAMLRDQDYEPRSQLSTWVQDRNDDLLVALNRVTHTLLTP
jgi:hypothetical protein